MIDGIKILNLSVTASTLLQNNRLLFLEHVEADTGVIHNRPRRSTDRGITFTINQWAGQTHCELTGSLHKYRNGGTHNANDFRAADLLEVINDLVTVFSVNPFLSRLNNVEFGVNIQLPFPVKKVLSALICYKGKPFVPGPDGPIYYQCQTEQFILKVYDKGRQYGRPEHLLRFEVKVVRMQFLISRGVMLHNLADLLNIENYPLLGKLLLDYFNCILFDDRTIKLSDLPADDQNLLRDGRNPRYWQMSDPPANSKEYSRKIKRQQRAELKFRTLLKTYRHGDDWQSRTAEMIQQKWQELTTTTPELTDSINDHLSYWRDQFEPENRANKCPEFTGVCHPEPAQIDT